MKSKVIRLSLPLTLVSSDDLNMYSKLVVRFQVNLESYFDTSEIRTGYVTSGVFRVYSINKTCLDIEFIESCVW